MNLLTQDILSLGLAAEAEVKPFLEAADAMAQQNTARVLAAFREHRVSDGHFAGTTGYGYDDRGRDTLDKIYAQVFGAEDALVRVQFVNGTHAITAALWGCLRPGQRLICATGLPYDTLLSVIGLDSNGGAAAEPAEGSLLQWGVPCTVVPMAYGRPDLPKILEAVSLPDARVLFLQRSRGYAAREALSCAAISRIITAVRAVKPDMIVAVDNCYGEFVEAAEPTQAGADLVAGSLIKNPGGGLALTGGYIAGRAALVERAAARLTTPGIGRECGSSLGQNRLLYQGFFLAPHVTAQALKTAVFAASVFQKLGYLVGPAPDAARADIIQSVSFGAPKPLLAFMRGIQSGAPVDSFVTPEPWDMPGYADPVVMAAGAFVQGASIELSADAPMRAPYTAYLQGGLTFESGKLGVLLAAQALLDCRER